MRSSRLAYMAHHCSRYVTMFMKKSAKIPGIFMVYDRKMRRYDQEFIPSARNGFHRSVSQGVIPLSMPLFIGIALSVAVFSGPVPGAMAGQDEPPFGESPAEERPAEEVADERWKGNYGVGFSQFQNKIEHSQNISGSWLLLPGSYLNYNGLINAKENITGTSTRFDRMEVFSLSFSSRINDSWSAGCNVNNTLSEHDIANSVNDRSDRDFNTFVTWSPRSDFKITESMGWGFTETTDLDPSGIAVDNVDRGYNHKFSADYHTKLAGRTKLDLRLGNHYKERNRFPESGFSLDGTLSRSMLGHSISLDFLQQYDRTTYQKAGFNELQSRKNTDSDLGITVNGRVSSLGYTFISELSDKATDYPGSSKNNSEERDRGIRASCSLPLPGRSTISMDFERNNAFKDYHSESGYHDEERDSRLFSAKVNIPAGDRCMVDFSRSISLAQYTYPEYDDGLDRDDLSIETGGDVKYTFFDEVYLSLGFDVEERRYYYIRSLHSISNYEKLTYRFSPELQYTLLADYTVLHTGTLSTAYSKYLYAQDRSAISLNYGFKSLLERNFTDMVKIEISHNWNRNSGGDYHEEDDGAVSFIEDYRKYFNTLELDFDLSPSNHLSLGLFYELQYTVYYKRTYDNARGRWFLKRDRWTLDQYFSCGCNIVLFSRGDLSFSLSKEFREEREDFWHFDATFTYEY